MGIISKKHFADIAEGLIKRAGTRNPFKIAQELGIHVLFRDDLGPLKGMYTVIKRNRFIFINSNLSERMQKVVCAHEIGHDRKHQHLAVNGPFKEFMLYQMDSTPEYEANIIAAEILLDSNDILDYVINYNFSAEQIAQALDTDVNLVALKIGYMIEQGYDLRTLEYRNNFLK